MAPLTALRFVHSNVFDIEAIFRLKLIVVL